MGNCSVMSVVRSGHYEGLIVKLHDIADQYADLERKTRRIRTCGLRRTPERKQLRSVKQVFDSYKLSFH